MNKQTENILLGISVGDLNGIGPEVIFKSLEDSRMLEFCTPILFANFKLMNFLRKILKSTVVLHGIDSLNDVEHGKINVLNVWKEGVNIEFGKQDKVIGAYAVKSFMAATKALKESAIHALVTAPIHKHNVQSEEFHFPGHTDYLNHELSGDALMLMVNQDLRIGLLTEHLSLSEVSKAITSELLIKRVEIINQSLIQDFKVLKPRIAILGVNPHAGDQGVIGNEELSIISPVIASLFEQGYLVSGPFPADGFFGSEQYKKFDAVLACYHDQGLIPFKTLSFGNGVNYTAGLDKVRTSPDHGTAYDIAGKGLADATSFRESIYLAIDVYKNRKEYSEITKNPLKKSGNKK